MRSPRSPLLLLAFLAACGSRTGLADLPDLRSPAPRTPDAAIADAFTHPAPDASLRDVSTPPPPPPDASPPDVLVLPPEASPSDAPAPAPDVSVPPRVLVLAGGSNGQESLNDTWTFDGANWTEVTAATPAFPGLDTLVTLDDGVVLFGEDGALPVMQFDGSNWTTLSSSNGPTGLVSNESIAALGDEAVLFGGIGTANGGITRPNQTWTYGSAGWALANVAHSPPARIDAAMATLGDKVLLFGGLDAHNGSLSDTWIFDGSDWTELQTATSPPACYEVQAATLGNEVVLFGCESDSIGNDTWIFDGANWTLLSTPASPPGRYLGVMAALGDEVVLFGGVTDDPQTPVGDTWIFDGSTWTEVTPAISPEGRYAAGLALLP